MGADPRIKLLEIGERLDKLAADAESIGKRVAEIERILLALTRANAGKDGNRGRTDLR